MVSLLEMDLLETFRGNVRTVPIVRLPPFRNCQLNRKRPTLSMQRSERNEKKNLFRSSGAGASQYSLMEDGAIQY